MTTLRPPGLHPLQIRTALKEALPDHPVPSLSQIQNIKEGSDHHVWSIGPNLILRGLPLSSKSESSLRRDVAVTTLLKTHLPPTFSSKIPLVLKTITIPPAWICNIEPRLPGKNLNHVAPTPQTLSSLSEFLSALTQIPIPDALAATEYEEPRPNLQTRVTRASQAWAELRNAAYVHDAENLVPKIMETQLTLTKAMDKGKDAVACYRPALLHGDLHGEHILIDDEEGGGEVLGVIDWSDALVGDPCRDLAGVVLAVGRGKAREVGFGAGYNGVTVERGLLYGMCLAVRDLRDSVVHGMEDAPEELLRSQFGRCFEGLGVEGVLA